MDQVGDCREVSPRVELGGRLHSCCGRDLNAERLDTVEQPLRLVHLLLLACCVRCGLGLAELTLQLLERVPSDPPGGVGLDDLVDQRLVRLAPALRLPHDLGIAAVLDAEAVDVEHARDPSTRVDSHAKFSQESAMEGV